MVAAFGVAVSGEGGSGVASAAPDLLVLRNRAVAAAAQARQDYG